MNGEAVELARFWCDNGLHVYWTDSKDDDGAKRCSRKWDELAKPVDGEPGHAAGQIAERLKRRNPIVALRNSGLVGIDCDSPADIASFKAFGSPPTYSVSTSKGRHFYYKAPVDATVHAILFENGTIQAKANQYFVAPPALHPSGHVYEGTDLPIVELPAELLAAMVTAAGARAGEERERIAVDPDAKVTEGGRHALLLSEAGRLANVGSLDEDGVVAALMRINETRCDPPKLESEVRRLAREAVEHWRKKSAVDRLLSADDDRPKPKRRGFMESLDDGKLAELSRWLPGFDLLVPVGELMNLVAVGGTGKGLFVVMLAQRLGGGAPLLYSGTEDNADRLKKRLDAAGSRGGLLRAWADERRTSLSFPRDVDVLRCMIEDANARLVVLDSGPSHLDRGLNNNKVEDVRQMVDALAAVCEETGATIVNVLHPPKSGEVLSGLGSGAWEHAARHQVFMVPDDEDVMLRHAIVSKTNAGQQWFGRVFRIGLCDVPVIDRELGMETFEQVAYLEPTGEESMKSLPDLLRKQVGGTRGRRATERSAAKELLHDLLTGEGEDAASVKGRVAAAVGCSERTVKNAFDELCDEGFASWHREKDGRFGAQGVRYVWCLSVPRKEERE